MTAPTRAVFDCNIYFQALISTRGPSGQCFELALSGKDSLVCSNHVIDELRETASDPRLRAKFTRITDAGVARLVDNIERVAAFLQSIPEELRTRATLMMLTTSIWRWRRMRSTSCLATTISSTLWTRRDPKAGSSARVFLGSRSLSPTRCLPNSADGPE